MDEAIPQSWPWFLLNDGGDKTFNPEPTFRKPRLHSTSRQLSLLTTLRLEKYDKSSAAQNPFPKSMGHFHPMYREQKIEVPTHSGNWA
ncbi:hypothetical protein I7I53_06218 [Histoplasma capsulatum var. duboisii H88]|nr:hypothetical protein I7I53_06218 [Histoplasma capsulatum var. duboisii H88]